jgi:flavin-dependent dehydrogenase
MTVRATKRGVERTPLDRDCDVLVCGASFAGLAIARELAGSDANVLMVDRYEVGERQTSACAAPTEWLTALELEDSIRQTFDTLVAHTPQRTYRYELPWTFSTFDYRRLCSLLQAQGDAEFETAKVDGITRFSGRVGGGGPLTGSALHTVHTDRGDIRAPLVIDALGWKRVLDGEASVMPPHEGSTRSGERGTVRLSRGLEVHPPAMGEDLEIWIDPRYIRAGYAWSFPARDELRVGVGSFEPRDHVKQPTLRIAGDLSVPPLGYQGNWIPHELRPAVGGGVFFVGDSAGHCLPLTAEGIRTALYFGIACGRELRAVLAGESTPERALSRYGAFSAQHAWKYRGLLNSQHAVGRTGGTRLLNTTMGAIGRPRMVHWMFDHYLKIAPPSFVGAGRPAGVPTPVAAG